MFRTWDSGKYAPVDGRVKFPLAPRETPTNIAGVSNNSVTAETGLSMADENDEGCERPRALFLLNT